MEVNEQRMSTNSDEEKLDLLRQPPSPTARKGGLATIPFILVNESFEKMASYGLMPNMIIYLMQVYNMEAATAAIILSFWSAMSNTFSIFGAFLSDSCLGRFSVILLGSISSLLGMTLLCLTSIFPQLRPPPCEPYINHTCKFPTPAHLSVLFSCFGLMSIGAGCIRPCSIAFGADQLDDKGRSENESTLQSYFNWYYASTALSMVVALTVVVYIQDNLGWQIGFGVPVALMSVSALMFLLGSPLYVRVKPSESLFTGYLRVLVAAFRNRNVSLSPDSSESDYLHNKSSDPKLLTPTPNLRFLNRACVIKDPARDLNPDGSAMNPWSLCTVEQVESLKVLLRITPILSSSIIVTVLILQTSFSTLQAKTMDRHVMNSQFEIPPGSFGVFMIVALTLWVAFYDRVMVTILARCTGRPSGLGPRTRMAIGIVVSCLAVAVSALVESKRRAKAIEEGVEDKKDAVLDMSAMWLIPQYALLGVAEAFYSIGQLEFFYSEFPKSMSSIAMALSTLGLAVSGLIGSALMNVVTGVTSGGGRVSWLDSNLNKGHVDYYYWLLTLLGLLNFGYFLICCWAFEPNDKEATGLPGAVDGEETDYKELPSA
ncbi:hypothetical protein NMG60_11027897 [Bertholletia excelsa]